MRIEILYFQILQKTVGTAAEWLEVPGGATAADAVAAALALHPALEPWKGSLMLAVNEEWIPRHHPLKEGDSLALMPPVSGG